MTGRRVSVGPGRTLDGDANDRERERLESEHRNDEYIRRKTDEALENLHGVGGTQAPELVVPGRMGDMDRTNPHQYSWDGDPGWRDRTIKQVRDKLEAGMPLMPKEFRYHETTALDMATGD